MTPATNLKIWILGTAFLWGTACTKDVPAPPKVDNPEQPGTVTETEDKTTLDEGPIDFSAFSDTYGHLASPDLTASWAHYNVHDPAYLVDDKFVYAYNTDVAYGHAIRPGIQIRRSLNLVEWEFVGWALPGLPSQSSSFIRGRGGEPFDGLWAPYVIKVGAEYRLYYSHSSPQPRLSAIGLATASSPKGPFRERGLVVTSLNNNTRQTNAIDPTVIIDKNGNHWMYYGSAWDGIYRLELNPETGLAMRNEDKGIRVAQRGFTGNGINGNLEGPEILYHPEFNQYYLFLSYDWLETKYNVRVGRSDSPVGPFYDLQGNNLNEDRDDMPMILAPYRFKGHGGWQGVSHPGVFEKSGRFYIGHQGRPAVSPFSMVMHVRQLFWTPDGWPLVSSQRYAGEEEAEVGLVEIAGNWEIIPFDYEVVPGYANEQRLPGFSDAVVVALTADGGVSGALSGSWSYESPWLTLEVGSDSWKLRVERGRDWEQARESTLLLTGMDAEGMAVWGKKIE